MNKNDQQFIAQEIRAQYMEKQSTELDELRALDAKVKRPANIFAYTFGSVAAIIMGGGMSLTMTDIGSTLGFANAMPLGIVIGVCGIAMAIATYPIYKAVLASRRRKFGEQIIALSDKLVK